MRKRLYRSKNNRVLCGVCGGIGEYFDIDPVIVRLILVVLCLVGFSGVIAYIIAAFVIPERPEEEPDIIVTDAEVSYGEAKKEDAPSENVESENGPEGPTEA